LLASSSNANCPQLAHTQARTRTQLAHSWHTAATHSCASNIHQVHGSPRHHTQTEPSFLNLNVILHVRRGAQYLPGPTKFCICSVPMFSRSSPMTPSTLNQGSADNACLVM
jgi:hypothetical protein